MRTRKTVGVLAVLALAVTVVACRKNIHVTGLPPGVSEKEVADWYTATGALKIIAETTTQARKDVIDLNRQGIFPDGSAYVTTLTALGRLAQAQINSANILNEAPNQFGQPVRTRLQKWAQVMDTEAQKIVNEGLLGIKNEDSRSKVNAIIARTASAVRVLVALVGLANVERRMETREVGAFVVEPGILKSEVNCGQS